MNADLDWKGLALLTLRAPSEAARVITGLSLSREVLWTALALVAVFNALLFSVSEMIAPVGTPLPAIFANPVIFFVIVAGGLVLSVNAFYWTGRMMGSPATDLGDLLALMIWLQMLRAIVQAGVLFLLVLSPALASLVIFAAGFYAVWILLHFLSVGLQFYSLWRALGVLIAGSLALLLGISLILSVIGVSAVGLNSNV